MNNHNQKQSSSPDNQATPIHNQAALLHTMTKSIVAPTVLALDGSWGTGKTHLIKTWAQLLKKESRPLVYFNAWDNDHGEDPFIGLAWAMEKQLPERLKQTEIWQKTITLARKLSNTFPVLYNHSPNLTVEESADRADNAIDRYAGRQNLFAALKLSLAELAKFVGEDFMAGHPGEQSSPPPIIFFIDELDRCHPQYVIYFLEMSKNLFNLPHIVFVYSVSMTQLKESVKAIYGPGLDADGFLWRFFDHRIPMPAQEKNQNMGFSRHIISALNPSARSMEEIGSDNLAAEFFFITSKMDLSNTEQYQAAICSDLICRAVPDSHFALVCVLVCLRLKHPKAFDEFMAKSFKFINLQDIIHWQTNRSNDKKLIYQEKLLGLCFGLLLHYCHDQDWPATQAEIARYAQNHQPVGLEFCKAMTQAHDKYNDEMEKIMRFIRMIMA